MDITFVNQIKGPLRGKLEHLTVVPIDIFSLTGKVAAAQLTSPNLKNSDSTDMEVTLRQIQNTSLLAGTVTVLQVSGGIETLPIKAEDSIQGLFDQITATTGFVDSDLIGVV